MSSSIDAEKLTGLVDRLQGKKILVVGDVGLDEYVIGNVRRISPEAPVPVVEVTSEANCLGLASNVAANVASLGGIPLLIGVVGGDQTGEVFKSLLKKNGCSSEYLITDFDRPTTRKLRVMAGHHHIVRVDFERKKYLSPSVENQLLENVSQLMPQCDGVILEDYAKGVLSQRVIEGIISFAHQNKKTVTLDPNRTTPIDYYKGVDYLTPNVEEALTLSELNTQGDLRTPSDTLQEVGAAILERTNALGVIVTRGKDGMSAFLKGGSVSGLHIPTFARSVFDVTGAGDTVIATFTLSLTAGLSVEEACLLSNYAAGIVVGKSGCVTALPSELKEYIRSQQIQAL